MKSPRTILTKVFKDVDLAYRRLWDDVQNVTPEVALKPISDIILEPTPNKTRRELFCNTDGGGFTVTLPAIPVNGQKYRIINTGSNILTIDPNGNNIIGLSLDIELSPEDILIITFDTIENWW